MPLAVKNALPGSAPRSEMNRSVARSWKFHCEKIFFLPVGWTSSLVWLCPSLRRAAEQWRAHGDDEQAEVAERRLPFQGCLRTGDHRSGRPGGGDRSRIHGERRKLNL